MRRYELVDGNGHGYIMRSRRYAVISTVSWIVQVDHRLTYWRFYG